MGSQKILLIIYISFHLCVYGNRQNVTHTHTRIPYTQTHVHRTDTHCKKKSDFENLPHAPYPIDCVDINVIVILMSNRLQLKKNRRIKKSKVVSAHSLLFTDQSINGIYSDHFRSSSVRLRMATQEI